MKNKKISKLQAYNAIIIFMNTFYIKNSSLDVADFITYAYFFHDKKPADPAAWQEWLETLQYLKKSNVHVTNTNRLTYNQAAFAMLYFFKKYCTGYTTIPVDMQAILMQLNDLTLKLNQSILWNDWILSLKKVIDKKDPRCYINHDF